MKYWLLLLQYYRQFSRNFTLPQFFVTTCFSKWFDPYTIRQPACTTMNIRLIRIAKICIQTFHRLDPVLPNLERRLLHETNLPPPIFIIGPPRSGSTILYEALTVGCKCAFITNVAALLYRCPVLITRMFHPHSPRQFSGKNSYGYIPGFTSPAEAKELNESWFDVPQKPQRIEVTRKQFAELARFFGGPVIIKNLRNNLRIPSILQSFPDARFIWLHRPATDTIQSLLIGRRRIYNDDRTWLGIKPPGWHAFIDLDPIDQIAHQVAGLEEPIRSGLIDIPETQILRLDLEEFCQSPSKCLRKISEWYGPELNLLSHSIQSLPERLPFSKGPKVDKEEWRRIEEAALRVSIS
ncbi:MAG: sulfotransferase [Chloroflexi bacterium]|nr:sulfotransferase [Chloroflexota bacterium]